MALGTIEVRQYVGQRPRRNGRPALADGVLYPTTGPLNRYRNILFVEKEGLDELWAAVQLAERYDLAIMSTKGMSVVAARQLLDKIAPLVDRIFVLYDFDVSGFSIFGTLARDATSSKTMSRVRWSILVCAWPMSKPWRCRARQSP